MHRLAVLVCHHVVLACLADALLDVAATQDLDKRAEELAFKSGIVCVTLLRYLTEHVKKLPLSAINRVLDTHGRLNPCGRHSWGSARPLAHHMAGVGCHAQT